MEPLPNSALITNTTLVESARLLAETIDSSRDLPGEAVLALFEFCNLAECLVLNEQVCTLPAELPEGAADLPFLVALRESGVLSPAISPEAARRAVAAARQLLGPIGNNRVYSQAVGNDLCVNENDFFHGHKERMADDKLSAGNYALQLRSIRYDAETSDALAASDPEFRLFVARSRRHPTNPKSLRDYMTALATDLNWQVSPNTNFVIHQIRNVVYWSVAETCNLSYSPDAARVDWLQSWNGHWRATIGETVYRIVAEAFRAKIEAVRHDEESSAGLLPPIPSMIAARAGSTDNLVEVILEIRNEFAQFRADLAGLISDQRDAQSIAARSKATERIKNLYASVSTKAANTTGVTLSTAIGYSGKLVGIIEDPLSLKAYAGLAEGGAGMDSAVVERAPRRAAADAATPCRAHARLLAASADSHAGPLFEKGREILRKVYDRECGLP